MMLGVWHRGLCATGPDPGAWGMSHWTLEWVNLRGWVLSGNQVFNTW
jgi:hypothetical protein